VTVKSINHSFPTGFKTVLKGFIPIVLEMKTFDNNVSGHKSKGLYLDNMKLQHCHDLRWQQHIVLIQYERSFYLQKVRTGSF
jgi:hypothetical protein